HRPVGGDSPCVHGACLRSRIDADARSVREVRAMLVRNRTGDRTVDQAHGTMTTALPRIETGTARPSEETRREPEATERVFEVRDLRVRYGGQVAVEGVSLDIESRQITALIGPSGCGKSTVLRCFNRMNDLVPGASVEGKITYHDEDLYDDDVDP